MNLVEAWIADLRRILKAEPLTVSDARIGAFYTAVELSSGDVGVAFTTRELGEAVCCPKTAASAPPAGRLAGQDAWVLAEYGLSPVPLRRSVGIATLNALSTLAVERCGTVGGRMVRGLDALDAAEVGVQDRVAMVGAFVPFSRATGFLVHFRGKLNRQSATPPLRRFAPGPGVRRAIRDSGKSPAGL